MISVLYVDDEEVLLEIAKIFIERSGEISVDTATSAPLALQKLKQADFDVIVSDYQMPEMDGIEFLRHLRAEKNYTPFIIFTGRGREEIVIQAFNEGADFYIQKGGEPKSQFAELTHKIQMAVQHRRATEKIQVLNRLYSVLSATNKAIVHLRTKSEFFSEICRILVETGGFRMVWIGLSDPEHLTIRPVTSAGYIDGYLDTISISTEDIPRGRGPTGAAYREGKFYYSNDVSRDPNMEVWRESALIRGYLANAAFPFALGTKNAGVISLYASVTGFFDAQIIDLLEELAIDMSFALKTIDEENDRKRAEMEIARRNEELHAAYEHLTVTEEELRQNYDELAKSQKLLSESEKQYRNVVEDQTEFISRFLPDGTHVFVNDAYCRYFGLKRNEIVGSRFRPKIPSEDQDRVKRFFASLTPDHPVASIEHRSIMPDGSMWWQWWSDRAIFDSSGTIVEYQSVGMDITEKKATEAVLLESEQRMNSIYNTVGDVIFQLAVEDGEHYRFTSVNSAFSRTTGLAADQVIGRNVNDIIPEPSLSMVLEKYRNAIEEKVIVHWEETSNYPSGQVTGDVSIAPIFDEVGTCTHLIGSVHDITERKRMEEALHQANRKLNLLSSITRHDINNQLTMLLGYLAMLEKKRADPAFNEYFQKAKTTVERISANIGFTREYQSIGITAPVWQDCRTLIDTAAKKVSPGKINVINDLPAGTEIFSDPLIEKVFYNLIDNALHYGGEKMTKIRFFSYETDTGLNLVCEDDGSGIDKEDKKHLFERGAGKNTGLGLFLSHEILSITGITIWEMGVPGEGARFEIIVPKGVYRVTNAQ